MPKVAFLSLALLCLPCTACDGTSPKPSLLTANVVNPQDVNAVSDFGSCSGHPYPETNSPTSGKDYLWPNSTNFSTTNVLREFAACDGTVGQNSDDTDTNEVSRGITVHLHCDGSSTQLRYFHITLTSGVLGQHLSAGAFMGYATMLSTGQSPSNDWQNSSNFDIAVSEKNDTATEDYFAKLDGPTFAAWSARGLTTVAQTISRATGPCTSFTSNPGSPDIFSFVPSL